MCVTSSPTLAFCPGYAAAASTAALGVHAANLLVSADMGPNDRSSCSRGWRHIRPQQHCGLAKVRAVNLYPGNFTLFFWLSGLDLGGLGSRNTRFPPYFQQIEQLLTGFEPFPIPSAIFAVCSFSADLINSCVLCLLVL